MGVSRPAAFSCGTEEAYQGGGRSGAHPPGVQYDVMPYNAGVAQSLTLCPQVPRLLERSLERNLVALREAPMQVRRRKPGIREEAFSSDR